MLFLCFGGGYGCTRILDLLDYDLIRKHPKLLIGFSDVTALHTAIGQNSRLVTIHGPMLKTYHENLRNIRFLLFVVVFACLFHSVLFRYLKNTI